VRAVAGTTPVYGGYATGIITHQALSYDGHEVAVAAISSDTFKLTAFLETGLVNNELAVGEALGRRAAAANLPSGSSSIILYDSVNPQPGHSTLNLATPLIEGISRHIRHWGPVAGMGMIGDMQLHPTYQWFEHRVVTQSAMLLSISGPQMQTTVMHGCRPAGRYYTITETDGAVVLKIDGKPALDVIGEMLGPDAGLSWDDYTFFVTLGVNRGDPYGPFREEDYANRLCIGIDRARKDLVMFENDLKPGARVQLMRRAVDVQYARQRTLEAIQRVEGQRIVLAFYIDCAGRAAGYSGLDEEEADEVRKALGRDVPLLGVYSGVEIAKIADHVQALDWTGVLCLFTE
jgi:small ligand-binding sensory domain FIST